MLRWRLILGVLFTAVLAGLCWLDFHAARPGVYLLPLAVVVALAAAGELLGMFGRRDHRPLAWVVYGGTLITVLAAGAPVLWQPYPADSPPGRLGWLAIGLVAALLLAVVGELRRYESPGQVTTNLALSTFAVLHAGGLTGFLVQLRLLSGEPWGDDGRWGMVALLSLVLVVKLSDIGQYTAGRLFGRHKLVPTVSPGKTWEGALGGMVGALLGALIAIGLGHVLVADGTWGGSVLYRAIALPVFAIVVAAAGMLGDLTESLLKRDAGMKDSSTWLPGFGGVLDLLDSLLMAAPVAYVFWALRIVGP